ncbi:MAG: bifunctional folylpolyglutamate synthase/dihydrofolate synthase, partial [Polyangiaceae bacterium]|nr:bifunctional folylpolyglutamate synthase/dihydrofolate synthase [Polyangiaceae bacterium]
ARFEDLQRVAPGKVAPDVPTAISIAQALGSPVVVAGSIYLVGETRAHLLGVASDPVIAM